MVAEISIFKDIQQRTLPGVTGIVSRSSSATKLMHSGGIDFQELKNIELVLSLNETTLTSQSVARLRDLERLGFTVSFSTPGTFEPYTVKITRNQLHTY